MLKHTHTPKKAKGKSGLKSDNTTSLFSMKWRRGGDGALDFSCASLLPLGGVLTASPGEKQRSENTSRSISPNPNLPRAKLGHFLFAL